jgi:alkylated DNA repair dioxygenase AlkB
MQKLHLPGADVRLDAALLPAATADALLQRLRDTLPWEQRDVVVQGRTYAQPRLVSWHGDEGRSYLYSGLRLTPAAWTEELLEIRAAVEERLAADGVHARFNSVLANLYREGRRDSMGMHSDSERELGRQPVIASVSLGDERTFKLAPKKGREGKPVGVRLPHGSLLLMAGATQDNWLHGMDKDPAPSARARLNLTFRQIKE